MQTVTFTVGDITVTIRNRTRRTAILQAKYRQVLAKAYPEVVEYEQVMYLLTAPRVPEKNVGEAKARYDRAYDEHISRLAALRGKYPVGAAYADRFAGLLSMLSRITEIEGAEFYITDGTFKDEDVIRACEDYLDGDFEVTEDDFWLILARRISEMDAPVTPVESKPPEFLTEDESKDPLSKNSEEPSKSEQRLEFSILSGSEERRK